MSHVLPLWVNISSSEWPIRPCFGSYAKITTPTNRKKFRWFNQSCEYIHISLSRRNGVPSFHFRSDLDCGLICVLVYLFSKQIDANSFFSSSWQVPNLGEDLLSSVDQPLKIARDKSTGKDYLLCDYNRDGHSYRLVKPRTLLLSFLSLPLPPVF